MSEQLTSQSGSIGTEAYTCSNGHLSEIKIGSTSVWKLNGENALGIPTSVLTGPVTRMYSYNTYVYLMEKFSYANLKKEFEKNKSAQEKQVEKSEQKVPDKPKTNKLLGVGGIKLTPEQINTLQEGGYIYLENMRKKDESKISANLFFDDQMKQLFLTKQNPETFVQYGKYEMRLMDKMRIEAGFVTKSKVKWYGGGTAYPYLWKDNRI